MAEKITWIKTEKAVNLQSLPDVTINEEEYFTIPEWQKEIVSQRMLEHEKNPKSGKSLDTVMKAISKKHGFKYRH